MKLCLHLLLWASCRVVSTTAGRESPDPILGDGAVGDSSTEKLRHGEEFFQSQGQFVFGSMSALGNEAAKTTSERHAQEKSQLMTRLSRDKSTRSVQHDRYRLLRALYSFSHYADSAMDYLNYWRDLYKYMSKDQKDLLKSTIDYNRKLDYTEELIRQNQQLCTDIVETTMQFYGIQQTEVEAHIEEMEKNNQQLDFTSVNQALKHLVRDWSEDGAHERRTHDCIISAIRDLSPTIARLGAQLRILVPGAGLGRLAHDIANNEGFEVTTNEYSLYMNLAYRFLEQRNASTLNGLYPFIDWWSHQVTTDDLQRQVVLGDDIHWNRDVLLVEGDFTTAFHNQRAQFDFVITHYFIDTARNLLTYFETIRDLLKPGGYWINTGPLLYGSAPFVQLSLDELLIIAETLGFEFLETDTQCGSLTFPDKTIRWMAATYGSNERSMSINAYKVQHWVARKG